MSKAMKFFDQAAKLVPAIAVMAGATVSALGAYIAVQSSLLELGRSNAQTEAKLDAHIAGYAHDTWFGDDRLLHPSLRNCVEHFVDKRVHEAIAEYQRTYVRPVYKQWQLLNPSLVIPDVTPYEATVPK